MRIILDTNVILSALITRGLSSRVMDICIERHSLFISDFIIGEVCDKLESKLKVESNEISRVKTFLMSSFVFIIPCYPLPEICRDPDDNAVLQLAAPANADVLITGDKDLLILNAFEGIQIMSPRDFMELSNNKGHE